MLLFVFAFLSSELIMPDAANISIDETILGRKHCVKTNSDLFVDTLNFWIFFPPVITLNEHTFSTKILMLVAQAKQYRNYSVIIASHSMHYRWYALATTRNQHREVLQ